MNDPVGMTWLGKAYALVSVTGNGEDAANVRRYASVIRQQLGQATPPPIVTIHFREIMAIIYRTMAVAELNAPASAQGTFIPAGSTFDAMAAVGKVLQMATSDVLIVDPYMDEKAFTDFAVLAPETINIRLMADHAAHKPSLKKTGGYSLASAVCCCARVRGQTGTRADAS